VVFTNRGLFYFCKAMETGTHNILLSTAYLPPVEYFYFLLKARKVYIEQYETYPKQTYRNRCEMYSEKGKMSLSLPVIKPGGNHTKTKDVKIFNGGRWYISHWRAIETAYLGSPFFLYYRDELEPFFTGQHDNLLRFNLSLLDTICKIIGIEPSIELTRSFIKDIENMIDLRFSISPKKSSLLKRFPPYLQVFQERHGFIPDLSIIDVLFNLGPDTVDYLESLEG